MTGKKDFFLKHYYCRICDKEHAIQLRKNITQGHERYPFSYIFLHGDLKNILTTLYIDKDAQIRGVDVQELTDEDIFSKKQVVSITAKMMGEIERLRRENSILLDEINELKKGNND